MSQQQSKVDITDTEDSFANSAIRPLLTFFVIAVVGMAVLLWGLQTMASLVGGSTAEAKAVDHEGNGITIAMLEDPPQLNSTKATDAQSGVVLGHVMEGLLRMDMQDRLTAGIAERWEVTSTHATFWLRKDAKWSDGKPVTSHDFKFAWQLVLDPANAARYAFLLYPIKNGRAVNEGKLELSDLGIHTPDDHTLIVEMQNPTPYFDKMVTFQTYFPVREDFYLSTNGKFGSSPEHLLFTGPFVLTEWVNGSNMMWERNPHYYNQERINLDYINVAYITQDATATLNFFKDDKIAYAILRAENLNNAMQNQWHIKEQSDGSVFYLEFNHRSERLTRNKNLRRAMQLVLDMEEMVYKVTKLPGYIPGKSLFPVYLQGENDKFRKEYPAPIVQLNSELALEHLEKARIELGLETWPELVLLSSDSPVSNIQSEWTQGVLKTKLGLDIKIDKQIFKQRLEKMTVGDFDMVLGGWGPDYNDPLTFGDLFATWNIQNRGRYSNPELDELIGKAQIVLDATQRMKLFGAIQDILIREVVIVPMYERGKTYVVHPDLQDMKRRIFGAEVDFNEAYLVKTE